MRYRFNQFEFNTADLLLTHNGAVQAIRHTEAKLLALLLEHADTVLNKDTILAHVWQDKVVSEQVVFQNISNLRTLFGNKAIKTFPKRGYQWQLICESAPTASSPLRSAEKHDSALAFTHKHSVWIATVVASIIFIAILATHSSGALDQRSPEPKINIAYLPIIDLDNKSSVNLAAHFQDNNDFDFTALTQLDNENFDGHIQLTPAELAVNHPVILTSKLRTFKQRFYLEFRLKGPTGVWLGELSASSEKILFDQLLQHLQQAAIYELISEHQLPELKQAKLSIAHQASPHDLIILRKLSLSYDKTNELDKAMAIADKLYTEAESQNNPQYMGRALLYQSKILTKKGLFTLSANKLNRAFVQLEKINDLTHLADAWYAQAWIDDHHKDYPEIKTSLLKSIQLAADSNNKLTEIDATLLLAVLAHDYLQHEDKYLYLQHAENKIAAYNMADYHFGRISFRYAMFATALSEKEPHLKQALALTTGTPENWIAHSSRKLLMQQYIAQDRLAEGQQLIDATSSDSYHNTYLRTLMAQARLQSEDMLYYAQRTFEQAQLAGHRSMSLDVALLLYSQQVNQDFYSQYIQDNSTAHWLSNNAAELQRLKL